MIVIVTNFRGQVLPAEVMSAGGRKRGKQRHVVVRVLGEFKDVPETHLSRWSMRSETFERAWTHGRKLKVGER